MSGVEEACSSYKDASALWVNGTEIAHPEGESALDIRLTRGVIRDRRSLLRADPRVHLRESSAADWLEVELRAECDEQFLRELVELAVQANQGERGSRSAR